MNSRREPETIARRALLAGTASAAVALPPGGMLSVALAQGVRQAAPPPTVTWDRRYSNGGVPFEPSWRYDLGRDPAKGEVHLAHLTRPVDGVGAVSFACDRDGARLDIQLTQPALALGTLPPDNVVAVTLETVCSLCGGPIDRARDAPIGSINASASTRARVVERNEGMAIVRVEGNALADFARIFARPTHYAMLGFGFMTRAITLDSARFRVIYEFQTLDSNKALAALAMACPAWPK